MSEEPWISSIINLLKCLEKQATASSQARIYEFRRSFESGSKKQQVLKQFEGIFQKACQNIPICYYPKPPVIQESPEPIHEDREIKKPLTEQEIISMITPEMLQEEEERLIKEREQHLQLASTWAKWWNSQKFQINIGAKTVTLVNTTNTDLDRQNFADAIISLFTALKAGQDLGLQLPANYKHLFHVPIVRGAISQKKINSAVRRMNNFSPEYANKIRNTLPNGAMQEMANNPNLAGMVSSLQNNSQAQKLVEKLSPK